VLLEREKFLAEMIEDFFFGYLPRGIRRFLNEDAAAALLFYVMSEGAKHSVGDKLRGAGVGPLEALRIMLEFYKMMGEGEYEVREGEAGATISIRRCFHDRFRKENGELVCVACVAALAGVLKAYFKKVEVLVDGRRMGARSDVRIVKRDDGEIEVIVGARQPV